jgi:hypothetical protein
VDTRKQKTFSMHMRKQQTITATVRWKKNSGRESQGAWRQNDLIDSKSPVVK